MFDLDYSDLIGIPFKEDGRGPGSYDCYGLLRELYARQGLEIPDYPRPDEWAVQALAARVEEERVVSWERVERKPGDVILFRIKGFAAHVGMYLGFNKFIHCWEGQKQVTVDNLAFAWNNRVVGYYRYVKPRTL